MRHLGQLDAESIKAVRSASPFLGRSGLTHLLQMAYIRLTVEMRKGSFLERVRLLLSVPSPRRW